MDHATYREAPTMDRTATADPTALHGAPAAHQAAIEAVDDTPAVSETYGVVYALTLLLYLPSLAALRLFDMYSFSPGYLLVMMASPLFAALFLMFTEPLTMSPVRTFGSAMLLAGLSLMGSVGVTFGGALLLMPFQQWIRMENMGPMSVIAVAFLALLAAPLVVSAVRTLRGGSGWMRVLRLAAIGLALGAVVAILVLTVQPSHPLTSLRTDQSSFLIAGLVSYLPGYAISAALWRRFGIA